MIFCAYFYRNVGCMFTKITHDVILNIFYLLKLFQVLYLSTELL